MARAMLPSQFSDLEPFARKWCLATEQERYAVRLSSTMEEMQGFYDACFPRAAEALAFCGQFPLDDMPEDGVHLLQLMYSLINVSYPVEVWHQPSVPDSGPAYLTRLAEPVP
jgi:hypothetical protein